MTQQRTRASVAQTGPSMAAGLGHGAEAAAGGRRWAVAWQRWARAGAEAREQAADGQLEQATSVGRRVAGAGHGPLGTGLGVQAASAGMGNRQAVGQAAHAESAARCMAAGRRRLARTGHGTWAQAAGACRWRKMAAWGLQGPVATRHRQAVATGQWAAGQVAQAESANAAHGRAMGQSAYEAQEQAWPLVAMRRRWQWEQRIWAMGAAKGHRQRRQAVPAGQRASAAQRAQRLAAVGIAGARGHKPRAGAATGPGA